MDLKDQLSNLFPDHVPTQEPDRLKNADPDFWIQDAPIHCKYEKRKGKPATIIEGYNGTSKDLKLLAQLIKKDLNVGGGISNERIIIQGDYRDRIMRILKEQGFAVKRVGG